MPQKWAKDPRFPLIYDKQMNEFAILRDKDDKFLIFYCPFCGGRLPESKRRNFYQIPDKAEVKQLRKLMKGVQDIETMRKVLGQPDQVCKWKREDDSEKVYKIEKWKKLYMYEKLWKSIRLWVFELDDSSLSYTWAGKGIPAGQSISRNRSTLKG